MEANPPDLGGWPQYRDLTRTLQQLCKRYVKVVLGVVACGKS